LGTRYRGKFHPGHGRQHGGMKGLAGKAVADEANTQWFQNHTDEVCYSITGQYAIIVGYAKSAVWRRADI
jgi:hypothetical protein